MESQQHNWMAPAVSANFNRCEHAPRNFLIARCTHRFAFSPKWFAEPQRLCTERPRGKSHALGALLGGLSSIPSGSSKRASSDLCCIVVLCRTRIAVVVFQDGIPRRAHCRLTRRTIGRLRWVTCVKSSNAYTSHLFRILRSGLWSYEAI